MIAALEIVVWPATVLVVAVTAILLLRKQLGALVSSTAKVKFKDLEVEFGEKLDALAVEARETIPPPEAPPATPKIEIDLAELASVSPSAAVLEAWKIVDAAARGLIERRAGDAELGDDEPYKGVQQVLEQRELIDERKLKVFDELRKLRNKVAHARSYQIEPRRAAQYVELSLQMRQVLDGE